MRKERLAVCIVGMPGSGKTTVADMLGLLGFKIVTLGDIVRMEVSRRGLLPTDDNLGKVMREIRIEEGRGAVAKLALNSIKEAGRLCVVDGVRCLEEVDIIGSVAETKLLAIHASPQIRFKRICIRNRSDIPADFEKFKERDKRELEVGLGEAIALADEVISNNDLTKDELRKGVLAIVGKWLNEFEDRAA
ncbi:MAG: AAA family ATPase [Nitrososphaerales archaeon]